MVTVTNDQTFDLLRPPSSCHLLSLRTVYLVRCTLHTACSPTSISCAHSLGVELGPQVVVLLFQRASRYLAIGSLTLQRIDLSLQLNHPKWHAFARACTKQKYLKHEHTLRNNASTLPHQNVMHA